MGFLEQIFGTELGLPARAVVALVLVLALIALTVWLMRRFGDGRVVAQAGGRGRQQRLAVLDSATVDARRRLVLIRRDNVEHLILIGGPTDVIVEQNIVRGQPLAGTARPAARGAFDDMDDVTIVPVDEPERPAPQPVPAQRQPAPGPRPEPPRTMPQPAPQRLDPQYADMAHRLEAALRKGTAEPEAAAARPAPQVAAPRPPEPRAPEPRAADAPRAPEPRATPAHPASPSQQSAADVFGSLEEEMASLLRPGAKKDNK